MEGSSGDGSSAGGEDQDESSSSNQVDLDSFREKWQRELRISAPTKNQPKKPSVQSPKTELEKEEEAKLLFIKGTELERSGKLYEAIQFYRRAVQLVPDIEFKLDPKPVHNNNNNRQDNEEPNEQIEADLMQEHSDDSDLDLDDSDIKEGKLLSRIQKKMSSSPHICTTKFDQTALHISSLPTEILFLILRWLVSSDLDLRSLEAFSMVCRGFYLCARDPEIWRLACLRVWGLNCGPSPGNWTSWRSMFIDRSRIQFNGCYISKTTYVRHGENSYQDQFYRPWYMVAYYRYLRFFPDGKVLVLTTADAPAQCLQHLRNKQAKNPVHAGFYRIKDDKVSLVVHSCADKAAQKWSRRRDALYETAEQTFHMEFEIRGKKHAQLVWTHYSIFRKTKAGDESTYGFDLGGNAHSFPALWFSRVKSYAAESDSPLQ